MPRGGATASIRSPGPSRPKTSTVSTGSSAWTTGNLRELRRLGRKTESGAAICKMTDFCRKSDCTEVPDPYYGGDAGFELVLDLIEDASDGLLERIRSERNL